MDGIDYGNESDHDPVSTEMLEVVSYGSQSHPNIDRIEKRYKIHDSIKQRQP